MKKFSLAWLLLLAFLGAVLLTGCPPPTPPPVPPAELGITINLLPGPPGTVEQPDVTGSQSPDKENHIRWFNQTDLEQTVKFEEVNWPFMEPYTEIVIAAGKHSAWFTMLENSTVGMPHPYKVTPLLEGTGPGEPTVSDGP